ncbi:MAG: DNA repair protein RecO [Chromatiales bacterium]|jgi:DNA repair protein RecO (recombination protein O)|nr:DNA repair protein RecO [Chromatiales bacterium]
MANPTRVELEPAWVLHTRQYRETSMMLEVFTPGSGRIGLVARGARRPKSPLRALLRPFEPLVLSWSGRGDLATLQQAERTGPGVTLRDAGLAAGFYANELLIRLLERRDPHPLLFAHYSALLEELVSPERIEPGLRNFEIALLTELGFGLNLGHSAQDHTPLDKEKNYEYQLERGVVPVAMEIGGLVFKGSVLLAIDAGNWTDLETRRAAKRLLRYTLDHYLDGRELKTRKVYTAMLSGTNGSD